MDQTNNGFIRAEVIFQQSLITISFVSLLETHVRKFRKILVRFLMFILVMTLIVCSFAFTISLLEQRSDSTLHIINQTLTIKPRAYATSPKAQQLSADIPENNENDIKQANISQQMDVTRGFRLRGFAKFLLHISSLVIGLFLIIFSICVEMFVSYITIYREEGE